MSGPAVTRRGLLAGAAGGVAVLAGGGVAARLLADDGAGPATPVRLALRPVAVPALPGGRPERQHAWNAVLRPDGAGDRVAPRHARLLLLDLVGAPSLAAATRLERALRHLEARTAHGPAGLLLAVGWSPAWFRAVGVEAPIPRPVALSDAELPVLEEPACCVHLAGDDLATLEAAERALRTQTRGAWTVQDVRAGVNGAGLARRAVRDLGLRGGGPGRGAPLLMGFRSGQRRAQATEDDVTLADGPWAGSTAMHVSQVALQLGSWYHDLSEAERRARMFAPQLRDANVERAGGDVALPRASVAATAREHGLVGHKQAAAQARRGGRPVILRRDVSGVRADGQPVTHFVALCRSVDDFAATRRAMDAARAAQANPAVGAQVNNGINEWTSVASRANFLVPPRSRRTCPGLDGWDRA